MPENPSAFPSLEVYTGYNRERDDYEVRSDVETGMKLRDYFAAAAMSGSLAGVPGPHLVPTTLARESYAHADAMLVERERSK